MKKIYLFVTLLMVTSLSFGQSIFINEIHYDNTGTDEGEAIEVAGPAGTDLSGYTLVGYNGNNGENYNTVSLTGSIPDQDDGYGTLSFPFVGLQNGSPDGVALVDGSGTVLQFLSYEGSFTAVDGPASGMTSEDIGVAEMGVDVGNSLQLGGTGTEYTNFYWQEAMTNTFDAVNTNQDFGGVPQPILTIVSPNEGWIFSPEVTDVEIVFSVQNFVVANGSGDGHIEWALDGNSPVSKYDTTPIMLTGLAAGSHTFYMELVDNSNNPLSPPVNATRNFSIATYTDVANLAALRNGTEGEYYRVTGEVFVTYAQSYRNQKWFQDATAGIKIDDNPGVITTALVEGDGVVNLKGRLSSYNQVLQLQPSADVSVNSSGNNITPEVITLADLSSKSLADYESELVKIQAVNISDYDDGGSGTADGTFQTGKNYPITDASGSLTLRTEFHDADYIGTALPADARDYVCIVGGYNGTAQVTPRSLSDIITVGVDEYDNIAGFNMYPNPLTEATLYISTQNNLEKTIQIFNVLGKKVFQTTTGKNYIDLANLHSGLYIIRVNEAGHVATRKLVIK